MAPLIAIAAVSAIAQAYNAERARGANKKVLDDLKRQFDAIVPPDYDVSINDPPKYMEQALQGANLDFSSITPEAYKVIGKYSPEAAQFVAEKNPTLVTGSAAQKEGRNAQIDALRQMQAAARGESPEMKIKLQQAADASQAQAQSRQQSLLQDAQRRGQAGSGLNFASMLQGGSDAMQGGAAASQNAALAAYKDKLSAIQSSGQLGRQLSQDELGQEAGNADILNSFNQRTSRAYQDHLAQRAAMNNQAQQFNLNREQDISNRNIGDRNDAAMFNLQNRNKLAQQGYENTRNERNYQNDLAYQKAAWAANEKARQNQLKSQSYGDQMSRASGRNGLGQAQMGQNTQTAQDYNNMISGAAGAASGYYSGEASKDAQREAQDREDARWDKYYRSRYGDSTASNYDKYGSMA